MRLSATQFLHKNNFEGKFFILFGEEEILKVKTSKKILKNQKIHSEKIKLDLEDDDFEKIIQNFLFSNSLFSSKKILIINLKRSRVTKAIKEKLTYIQKSPSEFVALIDLNKVKIKTVEEILNIFSENTAAIDCNIRNKEDIKNYISLVYSTNLPSNFEISKLIEMYEGNFSLLANDLDIEKILFDNESKELKYVADNSIKNSFKLIEHILSGNIEKSVSIVDSMEKNDRNSSALLLWMLTRDCKALSLIKEGKGLAELRLWGEQEKAYLNLEKKISFYNLKKLISLLSDLDKSLKGVIKSNPWFVGREIVREMASLSK